MLSTTKRNQIHKENNIASDKKNRGTEDLQILENSSFIGNG